MVPQHGFILRYGQQHPEPWRQRTTNIYDLEAEYARSVIDVPYRFVAGVLYDSRSAGRAILDRNTLGRRNHRPLAVERAAYVSERFPVSIYQSTTQTAPLRATVCSGQTASAMSLLEPRAACTIALADTSIRRPSPLRLLIPSGMRHGHFHCADQATGIGISRCLRVSGSRRVNVQFRAQTFNTFNTHSCWSKYCIRKRKFWGDHISSQFSAISPTWLAYQLLINSFGDATNDVNSEPAHSAQNFRLCTWSKPLVIAGTDGCFRCKPSTSRSPKSERECIRAISICDAGDSE